MYPYEPEVSENPTTTDSSLVGEPKPENPQLSTSPAAQPYIPVSQGLATGNPNDNTRPEEYLNQVPQQSYIPMKWVVAGIIGSLILIFGLIFALGQPKPANVPTNPTYEPWSTSDGQLTLDCPHGWTVTPILDVSTLKRFTGVRFSSGDAVIEFRQDHSTELLAALTLYTQNGNQQLKDQLMNKGYGSTIFNRHKADRLELTTFYNEKAPEISKDGNSLIAEWTGRTGNLGLTKAMHGYHMAIGGYFGMCFDGEAECPESRWSQLAPILKHCLQTISIQVNGSSDDNNSGGDSSSSSDDNSAGPIRGTQGFTVERVTPTPSPTPAPGQAYPITYATPVPTVQPTPVQQYTPAQPATYPQNTQQNAPIQQTPIQQPAQQNNNLPAQNGQPPTQNGEPTTQTGQPGASSATTPGQ